MDNHRHADVTSDTLLKQVLGIFQAREADYLDDEPGGYGDPRRKDGLTAADVASALGWTTGLLGENGRLVPDTPRAERVIARLLGEHQLEVICERASQRKGRSARPCYATVGFREKLAAVRTQAA